LIEQKVRKKIEQGQSTRTPHLKILKLIMILAFSPFTENDSSDMILNCNSETLAPGKITLVSTK